jgi:hypothetical protein
MRQMISSVIARLTANKADVERTVIELSAQPGFELGKIVDSRLLPITIDAENSQRMEEATKWLQGRAGVEFVDVVFVHFDECPPFR